MNDEILTRLIQQYGNSVLRMCYLYVKDYHFAEDITQETFLRVYEKYNTFENRSEEKTWIIRIAINLCKNHMRTHWFKDVSLGDQAETATTDGIDEYLDKNLISGGIMQLPPKYREVILLYYYQELTVKEISHVLNQKESTVLQRLRRAREKLRPLLQEVL